MSDPSQHTCGLNGLRIEGVPCPVCAPLSPIALDWDKVKQEAIAAFCLRFSCDPSDIKKHENPLFEVGVWLKPEIDAQLRALVARVAQEEREKYEGRIKELETALRPFADLAGSSEGFCSPQSAGERMWCNNHRAAYNEGECDVVKADKVLRGTP